MLSMAGHWGDQYLSWWGEKAKNPQHPGFPWQSLPQFNFSEQLTFPRAYCGYNYLPPWS